MRISSFVIPAAPSLHSPDTRFWRNWLMTIAPAPDEKTQEFYVDALRTLDEEDISYAVGGGYAMAHYTGIARNTKDLDIFVCESDHRRVLEVLGVRGYRTEYFYPFWIANALCGESFIDILYNSGNGLC